MSNNHKDRRADAVTVTKIEICGCTNEALERGDTCGQANCPNLNISDEERELCRREFGAEGVC